MGKAIVSDGKHSIKVAPSDVHTWVSAGYKVVYMPEAKKEGEPVGSTSKDKYQRVNEAPGKISGGDNKRVEKRN